MTAVAASLGVVLAALCGRAGRRARAEGSAAPDPASPGPPRWRTAAVDAWSRSLSRAGVEGDPARWLRLALASVGGVGALAATRTGPVGGAVVALVAGAALALALHAGRDRGPRRADRHVPALLEHTARSLRSGSDLLAAMAEAGSVVGGLHGGELGAVVDRVERGADLGDALRPWTAAHPRAPVRLSAGALEVAAEAGGARARALDGLAATLRSRTSAADETRALATQARASAAVMVGLPVVVAALGSAADPRLARTLFATPIGLGCVVAAVILDGAGAWWMQRVVDGASR
ncbi:MAG: type II secretion system F family protein [Iamia sp.]